jgi:hypothetical protein
MRSHCGAFPRALRNLIRRLPSAILRRLKRAGYLVEYDVGELAFWTVVAAVAKRSELAAMLAELFAQIVERC